MKTNYLRNIYVMMIATDYCLIDLFGDLGKERKSIKG